MHNRTYSVSLQLNFMRKAATRTAQLASGLCGHFGVR